MSSRIRQAAVTSSADRLPFWRRGVAAPGVAAIGVGPGLWIIGIVLVTLLAGRLTGRVWVAAAIGTVGMVLAAWHAVKRLSAAQRALARTEQARAAMEHSLLRSQKMETLGRLSVGAAHDFNNHLTVISSNVEMVARQLDGGQERLLRHTDAVLQAVRRAAVLTGLLLSFSRRPVPEQETVNAERLLHGLSDLLSRTLDDRVGLAVMPSDASWLTRTDVTRIENALLSMAVNARDQVPDGAVLTIAASNLRLESACASVAAGDYLLIAVGDAAVAGQPGEWVPADDPHSADLSMARAFVDEAGGYLLRSDPAAAGLSLRLFLPRYRPPAPVPAMARADTGGQPTILVVEDDATARRSCVEMLRKLDYQVLEAPDAMEAFRLIADHGGIDLLFTDIGLPGGVSGRALAEAARNVDAGIRVLFTSGYDRADLPSRGDMALLPKPFSQTQLAGMVHDVLAAGRSVARSETVPG